MGKTLPSAPALTRVSRIRSVQRVSFSPPSAPIINNDDDEPPNSKSSSSKIELDFHSVQSSKSAWKRFWSNPEASSQQTESLEQHCSESELANQSLLSVSSVPSKLKNSFFITDSSNSVPPTNPEENNPIEEEKLERLEIQDVDSQEDPNKDPSFKDRLQRLRKEVPFILKGFILGFADQGKQMLNILGLMMASEMEESVPSFATGFVLSVFFQIVLSYCFVNSIIEKLSTEVSKFMATNRYSKASFVLSQGFWALIILIICLLCPLVFISEHLLSLFGATQESSMVASWLIRRVLPLEIYGMINGLFKSYILAQRTFETQFAFCGVASLVISSTSALVGYFWLDLGLDSWLLARTVFETIQALVIVRAYGWEISSHSRGLVGIRKVVTSDYKNFLFDISKFMVNFTTEFIGFLTPLYFIYQVPSTEFSLSSLQETPYLALIPLLFIWPAQGLTTLTKNRATYLLSKGHLSQTQTLLETMLFSLFCSSLLLSLCLLSLTSLSSLPALPPILPILSLLCIYCLLTGLGRVLDETYFLTLLQMVILAAYQGGSGCRILQAGTQSQWGLEVVESVVRKVGVNFGIALAVVSLLLGYRLFKKRACWREGREKRESERVLRDSNLNLRAEDMMELKTRGSSWEDSENMN